MFDGNRFLPETGMPIWKMERSRTRFAVWLPDPLTVATWMLKSLTMRRVEAAAVCAAAASVGAIHGPLLENREQPQSGTAEQAGS